MSTDNQNEGIGGDRTRKNTVTVCFKCYQKGHYSTQCTNEKCVPVAISRLKKLEKDSKEYEELKRKEKERQEKEREEMRTREKEKRKKEKEKQRKEEMREITKAIFERFEKKEKAGNPSPKKASSLESLIYYSDEKSVNHLEIQIQKKEKDLKKKKLRRKLLEIEEQEKELKESEKAVNRKGKKSKSSKELTERKSKSGAQSKVESLKQSKNAEPDEGDDSKIEGENANIIAEKILSKIRQRIKNGKYKQSNSWHFVKQFIEKSTSDIE